MINIVKYSESDNNKWNEFCDSAKNSIFLFNRNFMDYHSDRFVDHSLMIYKDNKLVALFPASEHGQEIISHGGITYGGFITKLEMRTSLFLDIFSTVKDYYSSNGIVSITIKALPDLFAKESFGEQEYALFLSDAKKIKCDLSTVISYFNRGKVSKGRKWIINKAKKSGVIIKQSDERDVFCELLNGALEKHSVKAVHTPEELALLMSRFPDNIKLYMAEYDGTIVSGLLLFIFDSFVHTQYLATSEYGKEIGALDFLINNVIEEYSEKNYFSFGISSENNGKTLNYGLCQQKESFGGVPISINTFKVELI